MKKKIYKISVSVIILLMVWIYGIGIGKYMIFPYKLIAQVRHTISKTISKTDTGYMTEKYIQRIDFFNTFIIDTDITMLGDSITSGIDWTEVFPNKVIVNRGIGGDTTNGVLHRLDSVLSNKPEKVFILLGINDFGRGYTPDEVFDNYTKIIEELIKNDIEVYVQSTLYVSKKGILSHNEKVELLNSYLGDYCKSSGITYININETMSINNLLKEEITTDGVHLNSKGYLLWKEKILTYVY